MATPHPGDPQEGREPMKTVDLEQTAQRLSRSLRRAPDGETIGPLLPVLLRLIARGKPATPEEIATATGAPVDQVRAQIASMIDYEIDADGNLLGAGLTLRPTQHRFRIGERQLFTWCALDTLMYPSLLGEDATVESPCRATGEPVRVEVDPHGVRTIAPPDAVVSIVVPDECCSTIRSSFCNEVHFFASRDAASGWLHDHPGAQIVSVQEAFEIGRLLNAATGAGDGQTSTS
jgi:alkylmercury lyase